MKKTTFEVNGKIEKTAKLPQKFKTSNGSWIVLALQKCKFSNTLVEQSFSFWSKKDAQSFIGLYA